MEKKFKPDDKVYHNSLKLYGTFVCYAWETDEECDVDFLLEDGYIEQRHVTVARLELVE